MDVARDSKLRGFGTPSQVSAPLQNGTVIKRRALLTVSVVINSVVLYL